MHNIQKINFLLTGIIILLFLVTLTAAAPSSGGFNDIYSGSFISTNIGDSQTEGDLLVRSNGVREVLGIRGAGTKIGVIANGAESISVSQTRGELSTVEILDVGTGDEGTAMLEIIHDIVPDADLAFSSYGENSSTFKQAVSNLAGRGCTVICDDLYFFRQPFFQDGDVAEHIKQVMNQYPDLIFVTVAGNFALLHYQGEWSAGESLPDGSTLQQFEPMQESIHITLPAGKRIIATLQWDDPWDNAVNDYDLRLTDNTGRVLTESTFSQDGTGDPFEHIAYKNNSDSPLQVILQIPRNNYYEGATGNTLELFIRDVDPANVEENFIKDPVNSIFGHAALPEVVTVGSVIPGDPYQISPDSSRGPVTIKYPEPQLRLKPDICAPTNVMVSGSGDFPTRFPGTSAAAPHVAGVFALLKSAFPNATRDDLISAVYSTTQKTGGSGWDMTYGYGMIDAENAYYALFNKYR